MRHAHDIRLPFNQTLHLTDASVRNGPPTSENGGDVDHSCAARAASASSSDICPNPGVASSTSGPAIVRTCILDKCRHLRFQKSVCLKFGSLTNCSRSLI